MRIEQRQVLRGFAAMTPLEQWWFSDVERRGMRLRQVMPPAPRDGAGWIMFSIFFGKEGL